MSVERDQRADGDNAISDSWLARFFAFILGLIETFAATTPRQYREAGESNPDWRDHWATLRTCEWHREQIIAREAMQLLTGKPIPFQLIEQPPEGYIGPCPKTPAALARRFQLNARWMQNPERFIRRHARRIAKRAGIALSRNPLRLAATQRSTSPTCVASGGGNAPAPLASLSAQHWGRWIACSCTRDGGGLAANRARAPPAFPLFATRYSLLTSNAPAFEIASARPRLRSSR